MYKEISKEIPLYKGRLVIIICNDIDELCENTPDFNEPEIFAHSYGREYYKEEGYFILINPNPSQANITEGVIAHEALHIVNILFQQRGVYYYLDNNEHACYLLEWIVNEVCTALSENK